MANAAASAPIGLDITFQGKPCLPIFSYERHVGLEPNFGFVTMLRQDFKDFVIKESLPGVDVAPEQKTQEKPSPKTPGFLSAGQLVLRQLVPGENGGKPFEVKWDQVLITERGAEVAFADDTDENEVVRVELTDIRYLYKTRGLITGLINVPFGGIPEGGATTEKLAAAPKLPNSLDEGKPWTVESVFTKKILPNLPGSPKLKIPTPRPAIYDAEVGPKVWDPTLAAEAARQVLEDVQGVFALNLDATVTIWPRNVGDLQLTDGTKFTALSTSDPSVDPRVAAARKVVSFKHVPSSVVVIGAPAIQGIRMRLEACGMLDGNIVPLPQALAGIGLDMARATKFAILTREERAAKLGITEDGLNEFERWAFKWFRLPGGAEANADKLPILDARAAIATTGELLPVRVFSENHTVVKVPYLDKRKTAAGAKARIPAKQEQLKDVEAKLGQSGLSPDDRKELQQQRDDLKSEIARLEKIVLNDSGAGGPLADQQKAQAAVDKANADAKAAQDAFEQAVKTDGATSQSAMDAFAKYTALLGAANKAAADFNAAQAKDAAAFNAAEKAEANLKAARDAFEAAVKTNGPNSDEAHKALDTLTATQNALLAAKKKEAGGSGNARARSIADKIAAELAGAKVEHIRIMTPLDFGEQASGFRIDADRGLVIFEAVQGRVVATDQDSTASLETGLLSEFAAVELEFCFARKPGLNDPLTLAHRYSSVWTRTGNGPSAKVEQRPDIPPGVAPLVIGPLPALQQIDGADGKTNKPFLDALAKRLAEQQLKVEQSTEGAIIDFCRPLPVINTGSVLSVSWSVGSDEIPRCTAHVGTFARLAPPTNELRTRAYGGLVDPGSAAGGAIYVPKGLQ